jgi:FtsP/CotA-like multicopper oxidase with cupredoxin domain
MKLLVAESVSKPGAAADVAATEDHGGHAAGHDHGAYHDEGHATADGIEWEDDMAEVNRLTTAATMYWKFLERTSGADSATIDWQFRVGERVKIRLVNEMDSDHPMHHPFHLHGAGRFLVLSRDGVPEPNLRPAAGTEGPGVSGPSLADRGIRRSYAPRRRAFARRRR